MTHPLPAPPRLRAAEVASLLDVDGTLVEIEREPGAVHVPKRLCQLLAELRVALGGALALVSGCAIAQLDRLGGIAIGIGSDGRPTGAGHGLADLQAMPSWLRGILAAQAA